MPCCCTCLSALTRYLHSVNVAGPSFPAATTPATMHNIIFSAVLQIHGLNFLPWKQSSEAAVTAACYNILGTAIEVLNITLVSSADVVHRRKMLSESIMPAGKVPTLAEISLTQRVILHIVMSINPEDFEPVTATLEGPEPNGLLATTMRNQHLAGALNP